MLHNGGTETTAVGASTTIVAVVAVVGANRSSNTGPILAFIGALLVAVIAAYTAHRRQKAALIAERQRLDDQLRAESERLERQLAHERRLADVAELRVILEHILDIADEYVLAADDIRETVLRGQKVEGDALGRLVTALTRFLGTINQLQIRLPDQDPLVLAHRSLYDAFNELQEALEGDDDSYDAANRTYTSSYRLLVTAAKSRVGSITD